MRVRVRAHTNRQQGQTKKHAERKPGGDFDRQRRSRSPWSAVWGVRRCHRGHWVGIIISGGESVLRRVLWRWGGTEGVGGWRV